MQIGVRDDLERRSVEDAQRAIRFAHVVVLVLDANMMLERQDLSIAVQNADLVTVNIELIRWVFQRLGICAQIVLASELGTADLRGEARLIGLIQSVASSATYIHGRGGAGRIAFLELQVDPEVITTQTTLSALREQAQADKG